jgi:hypothetical protein
VFCVLFTGLAGALKLVIPESLLVFPVAPLLFGTNTGPILTLLSGADTGVGTGGTGVFSPPNSFFSLSFSVCKRNSFNRAEELLLGPLFTLLLSLLSELELLIPDSTPVPKVCTDSTAGVLYVFFRFAWASDARLSSSTICVPALDGDSGGCTDSEGCLDGIAEVRAELILEAGTVEVADGV